MTDIKRVYIGAHVTQEQKDLLYKASREYHMNNSTFLKLAIAFAAEHSESFREYAEVRRYEIEDRGIYAAEK